MKKEKIKKSLAMIFLLAFSLTQVTCKKVDAVKIINSDFLKCKINGVDYHSLGTGSDTATTNSGTFRFITTTGDASNSRMIRLGFLLSLTPGTYPTTAS